MIEGRELVAGYGHGVVLHGISMVARPGERIAILGANAAGKTTLLRTLMGLVRPRTGSIFVDGRDVTSEPTRARPSLGVALVPEGRRVFPGLSVKANMQMGAYTVGDSDLAARTLSRLLDVFPVLREKLGERAGALSGGQQQMLAIARAMMCRPRILLMDEPSLGLSPQMRSQVFTLTRQISEAEKVTVILVEQDVERALSVCDRFYAIKSGRIALTGEPATASRSQLRDIYL